MVLSSIPSEVHDACSNFVSKHSEFQMEVIPDLLSHDGNWKDLKEVLSEVTIGILNTLSDSWENSAFGSEFVGLLNENTYVTNIIVPGILATLKNLPFGKSSSERQSTASADRKEKGNLERRPDIIFIIKFGDRVFELMYTECSHLICSEKKKNDDRIKLWREANDGMYWVRKGRKPDIDEFGIISLQVAGDILHLNVLIKDEENFHRYCHLRSVKIPVQLEDSDVVSKFVEALLIVQNIIIVNIFQLYHAPISKSERHETDSLKMSIASLEVENAKLRKKFAEIEARNAELKARIAKLEDKQLQNEMVKNLLSVSRKT
ncbi:hypothetical protein C1646_763908 [Rhizophagus diaphanus]|nr:hypothetical protein C1646_763908 [Rhizophagus diaphanus] [Rhizophagus sp. MUCL 43196]